MSLRFYIAMDNTNILEKINVSKLIDHHYPLPDWFPIKRVNNEFWHFSKDFDGERVI